MEVLTTGYGLLEGPLWEPEQGLYFSDVPNGGVYRISLSNEVSLAIPHRRGIGSIALHEAGGLVVGGLPRLWRSAGVYFSASPALTPAVSRSRCLD